jgi:hypothetical protein
MKKRKYILGFLVIILGFNGCDYISAPNNYYVSVYNNEDDKYITSVYYRDYYYGGDRWSRNVIGSYIYPYESFDMILEEGTYDFKVFMEDDYYSYELGFYDVYVYENVTLDVCYDCYDKSKKVEVKRTPKEKDKKE